MLKTLRKRVRLTLIAAAIATTAGTLAGILLVRAFTVRVTEIRLEQYAAQIMADGEASSAELRTILAAMSASAHAPCSAAEIGYFRDLIFESDFLKDAGRVRDGKIECSAALGRLTHSIAQPEPDLIQQDGTKIYKNLSLHQSPSQLMTTLQLGDSFVVFTPYTRMHLEPPPMHYSETATDAPTLMPVRLLGESSGASMPVLTTEGIAHVGDSLYATRCSIRFFTCVTAFTSLPEVVQANWTRCAGGVALCGLSSGLFAILVSLLYRRNKSLEQQLRRAIARDKLRVFYQPIVHLASRRIAGAEALVRWTNEEGHTIGPDVFVKLAEQNGFVGAITKLVLRHSLRDLGTTLRSHPEFKLSINVAASDLSDSKFLPMLEDSLKREAVPAKSLTIEITESSTVRRDVAIEAIRALRRKGHNVHIDDFGTGYSSLAYLHELSVDAIKIDKAFTQAIGTEAASMAILPNILAMASALNLRVIAEGVETQEQASYFAEGDDSILTQGWLFGRPMPATELRKVLDAGREKPGESLEDSSMAESPIPLQVA
ncbi:MAG: EAL domain-containing protein [Terracidiphilus sp.]|jgi:sensor c-di-GMP phosphodiesterase-like protein